MLRLVGSDAEGNPTISAEPVPLSEEDVTRLFAWAVAIVTPRAGVQVRADVVMAAAADMMPKLAVAYAHEMRRLRAGVTVPLTGGADGTDRLGSAGLACRDGQWFLDVEAVPSVVEAVIEARSRAPARRKSEADSVQPPVPPDAEPVGADQLYRMARYLAHFRQSVTALLGDDVDGQLKAAMRLKAAQLDLASTAPIGWRRQRQGSGAFRVIAPDGRTWDDLAQDAVIPLLESLSAEET